MAIRQVGPVARAALIGIALPAIASAQSAIPLKEAKLNIEHNATDHDTGFQGAIDSEGWKQLTVWGPDGVSGTMPKFDAVIEEISVKYTMFDPNGRPLRATAH